MPRKRQFWRRQNCEPELLASVRLKPLAALAYHRLLIVYRLNEGPLPDDNAVLSRLIYFAPKDWANIRSQVALEFTVADGFWINADEDGDIAESREISRKRSAAGKAGRAKQLGNCQASADDERANAQQMPEHRQANARDCSASTSTSSKADRCEGGIQGEGPDALDEPDVVPFETPGGRCQ